MDQEFIESSKRIWFTADHHFQHANIIKFCDRPFPDVGTMDRALVDNWNRVVREGDTVYHLGDYTLMDIFPYRSYLEGDILLVPGGHDHRWLKRDKPYPAKVLPPLVTLEFPIGKKYPLVVVLCHYPMLSWDRSHHGSIHLHGHSHGTLGCVSGKRIDVGVDCHDFRPISLAEVFEMVGEV